MENQANPYEAPRSNLLGEAATGQGLASRGARLGASLVDTVLLMILVYPLALMFGMWDTLLEAPENTLGTQLLSMLLGFAAFILLNGYLLHKNGQTIGKKLLGIRIVGVDGSSLPLGRLLALRYVPQWLVSALPYIGGLLCLVNVLFIFGEERRCIHDRIAGTKVVKV